MSDRHRHRHRHPPGTPRPGTGPLPPAGLERHRARPGRRLLDRPLRSYDVARLAGRPKRQARSSHPARPRFRLADRDVRTTPDAEQRRSLVARGVGAPDSHLAR